MTKYYDPLESLMCDLIDSTNTRLHELETKRVAASKEGDSRMAAYYSGARDQLHAFVETFITKSFKPRNSLTDDYVNQRWVP